jgi:hypothetical protein
VINGDFFMAFPFLDFSTRNRSNGVTDTGRNLRASCATPLRAAPQTYRWNSPATALPATAETTSELGKRQVHLISSQGPKAKTLGTDAACDKQDGERS